LDYLLLWPGAPVIGFFGAGNLRIIKIFAIRALVDRSYLTETELDGLVRSMVDNPEDASELVSAIHMGGAGAATTWSKSLMASMKMKSPTPSVGIMLWLITTIMGFSVPRVCLRTKVPP